jgi:hypothetical protein
MSVGQEELKNDKTEKVPWRTTSSAK